MKKNIIYMAALAIMAAACSSEDDTTLTSPEHSGKGEVKMITETIRATNGDGATRAAIDDNDDNAAFSWSTGDKIAVHVNEGKYYTTAPLNEGGAEATFTVTYTDGYSRDAFAVYPATIVAESASNYGQDGATLDVTLPDSYTLAQVSGTTTPCPMIAENTGDSWEFKQLCGLLRLTVSDIPTAAKRLEIDFNGKKVCGDFSIAPPATPDEFRVIETSADASNDKIVITKDGTTDVALGSTKLMLNIPLPVGDYSKIDVAAYDALSGGTQLLVGTLLSYQASRAKGVKRATALGNFKITIKDEDSGNVIEGLRFVRIFSSNNKLHNGPYTISSNKNMPNPIFANLVFDSDPEDEFVFQVIDKNGKVYSGSMKAPAEGYVSYVSGQNVEVAVKAYTFTVASGKKVYFSPGDLGVNSGVYSFTEPFTNWSGSVTAVTNVPSQRSWFDYTEIDQAADPATQLYGITWRIEGRNGSSGPYEWDYIITSRTMNSDVNRYYKVTVGGNANCLLLPPDEALSDDIGSDLTGGSVTNYLKYLAKGFVLLMNAKRGDYNATKKTISWSLSYYSYWTVYDQSTSRRRFEWTSGTTPGVTWSGSQFRMHVRLIHDAN